MQLAFRDPFADKHAEKPPFLCTLSWVQDRRHWIDTPSTGFTNCATWTRIPSVRACCANHTTLQRSLERCETRNATQL